MISRGGGRKHIMVANYNFLAITKCMESLLIRRGLAIKARLEQAGSLLQYMGLYVGLHTFNSVPFHSDGAAQVIVMCLFAVVPRALSW